MSQLCFIEFFLSQRTVLLRTLQKMVCNPCTAEDLLQETFLRVSHALTQHTVNHLAPFVYQTARHLALDHLRARQIQAKTMVDDVPLEVVQSVVQTLSNAEDTTHARRLLEQLTLSIGRLSIRQQQIFTLSRLDGCSCPAIALQLHVSASTVQKELKLIMALCNEVACRHEFN